MLLQGSYKPATHAYRPAGSGGDDLEICDGRYVTRIARSPLEIESALRLRYRVFRIELAGDSSSDPSRLEFDEYDFRCKHLIVVDTSTGATVGTYRLSSFETGRGMTGFYSYDEFSIEDLPRDVLQEGVEIGRACIAPEHRNTKVLFLLWKGLAAYLRSQGKRYFFGCCSIFTQDERIGATAYRQLSDAGHLHPKLRVTPRKNALDVSVPGSASASVELPGLFNMYLRIGARVCGPPMIDRDFGTIDFFVVCDTHLIGEKYRRMFFGGSNGKT